VISFDGSSCDEAIRTVTSDVPLPACATWDDTKLTLSNCDYTAVGVYNLEVRKGGWINNFKLTITCDVTSITEPAGPLAMSYTINAPSATTLAIPAYTMTPYCGQ